MLRIACKAFILNVITLNVILLIVIMPSVIMLSVSMPSEFMLRVMAPIKDYSCFFVEIISDKGKKSFITMSTGGQADVGVLEGIRR